MKDKLNLVLVVFVFNDAMYQHASYHIIQLWYEPIRALTIGSPASVGISNERLMRESTHQGYEHVDQLLLPRRSNPWFAG